MITAITPPPVVHDIDPEREVTIESDSSYYVSAEGLSQRDHKGVLHPVAYIVNKHIPDECNYDIYDMKVFATIRSREEWRLECEGAAYPFQLITDNKNLEYCMSMKLLN